MLKTWNLKIREKIGQFWSQIARLPDHQQKWFCTFWKGLALRISVGGLGAGQSVIKIDQYFRGFYIFCFLIFFLIFYFRDKIDHFWSRIARLTDHPQKWFCTFWNCQGKAFPKSTEPFLWVVCGLSNSRSNLAQFYREIFRNTKFSRGARGLPQKVLKPKMGFKVV